MKAFIRGMAASFAAFVLCLNVYIELRPQYVVGTVWKLGFAALFVTLLGAAFFFGVPERTRAKRRRDYVFILFGYYLWVLANVLFFDNAFGRDFSHIGPGTLDAVNLEPFRTIHDYLIAYRLGNISGKLTVLNLLGNLTAFGPMGFFLPALYRWQRSIFFYLATLALGITTVEVAQVYLGVGSCDIDDLILNLTGAFIVFVICRLTPEIWQYIKRVTPNEGKRYPAGAARTSDASRTGGTRTSSASRTGGTRTSSASRTGGTRTSSASRTGETRTSGTSRTGAARTGTTRTAPKPPGKKVRSTQRMK